MSQNCQLPCATFSCVPPGGPEWQGLAQDFLPDRSPAPRGLWAGSELLVTVTKAALLGGLVSYTPISLGLTVISHVILLH